MSNHHTSNQSTLNAALDAAGIEAADLNDSENVILHESFDALLVEVGAADAARMAVEIVLEGEG